MQVTIEYAAQFKSAAGIGSETVVLDGPATVAECVRIAAERHGDGLRKLLFDSDGSLHGSTLAFIGGEQVRWDQQHTVRDGDVITLLPPISGG